MSIGMALEDVDGIDTIETIDADGTEHYYSTLRAASM